MNKMNISANPAHSNPSNEAKIAFSKAEVREMVQNEVQNAKVQSQARLDGLLETLQQLANDTQYESTMAQMERKIETLKRRADAAIDHVRQLDVSSSQDPRPPKIPLTPAAVPDKFRIIRSDLANDSECAASHENQGSPAKKLNGRLLQVIEATKNAIRMMQADNEALKVTHEDLVENSSSQPKVDSLHETQAMKKESNSTETCVDGRDGVKEEPVEETIAMRTEEALEEKPLNKHEDLMYPPLPATPSPAILPAEAESYSAPPRLSLQLALIRQPPGLSALWNLEEEDPLVPPMESYSVYMAMEKDSGSGFFPEWKRLAVVKAIPLPMCIMITKVKPGFKACFAVVGKDTFGRYGPYSKISLASVPDQEAHKPPVTDPP